jgi:hypothetical protein
VKTQGIVGAFMLLTTALLVAGCTPAAPNVNSIDCSQFRGLSSVQQRTIDHSDPTTTTLYYTPTGVTTVPYTQLFRTECANGANAHLKLDAIVVRSESPTCAEFNKLETSARDEWLYASSKDAGLKLRGAASPSKMLTEVTKRCAQSQDADLDNVDVEAYNWLVS